MKESNSYNQKTIQAKNVLDPSVWLQLYGDYLFSIALLKTCNRELAEDLLQDTFLSAIKSKDSFRAESSEKTWLITILKNKITDYYRKKDVLKDSDDYLSETNDSFHQSFFSSVEETYGHWTAQAAPKDWQLNTSDNKLMSADFNRIFSHCIESMPTKLIPVFIAKFVDEEDSEKICKAFNISASNFWVIIHRAKVLMRSCLEKKWKNL